MDDMELRYDRRARTYERCWAPVLRGPALSLLDLVATEAARPGASILDVGTGAGTLAIGAVQRFPATRITALDVSSGMLERARTAVGLAAGDAAGRITFVHASIEGAVGGPVAEASFDVAVSSFVLQLVPDRAAALAAIRRALRPGGRLAFVVWADNAKPDGVAAAWKAAFDGVLAETGLPAPDVPNPVSSGPIPDPATAAAELAAAGFVDAVATEPPMVHDFGRDGARAMMVDYDGAAELAELPAEARSEIVRRFDAGLAALGAEAFVWRPRIVMATGRRPA